MAALATQRRLANEFDVSDFDDAKTLVAGPVARPRGELSQVISLLELETESGGTSRVSLSNLLKPAQRQARAATAGRANAWSPAPVAVNAFVAAPVPSIAPTAAAVPVLVAPERAKAAPLAQRIDAAVPARVVAASTATARRAKRQPTQVLVRGKEALSLASVAFVAVAVVLGACYLAAQLEVVATVELLVPLTCAAAVVSWFVVGVFGRISALAPLICAVGTPLVMIAAVPTVVVAIGAAAATTFAAVAAAVARYRFAGAAAS